MSNRRSPRGAAAAVVPAALVFALVMPTGTVAAPMPDYPSWEDVQAAKGNQAAAAAQITKIEGILSGLEAKAAELGKIALMKAEDYQLAVDALDAATLKVTRLTTLSDDAQKRAEDSVARAARLIAQLARTGGGDVTLGLLMGSANQTDQLLSRLSTMNRVTETSADILARAEFDQNQARALAADAKAAEKVRKKLASDAQEAYAVARAASDAAEAEVASTQADIDRMYNQLASLKNITAQVVRDYQEGLTAEQEAAQNNPPSPPPTPPSGVDPTPPAPSSGAVAQATAFARAQLGEPYQLGGAGPDVWDCSGLTKMSYASAGVYIGTHSATNQYSTMSAQGRLVPLGSIVAGDLLFYSNGGTTGGSKYHVAIYLGGGQMIESPRPGLAVRIVAVRYGDLVPYAGRPTG